MVSPSLGLWALVIATSVVDGRVGRGPKIARDTGSLGGIRQALGHEDAHNILPGIRMTGGAVAAVPAEPSGERGKVVAFCDHGQSESPAAVVSEEDGSLRLLVQGQMIATFSLYFYPFVSII